MQLLQSERQKKIPKVKLEQLKQKMLDRARIEQITFIHSNLKTWKKIVIFLGPVVAIAFYFLLNVYGVFNYYGRFNTVILILIMLPLSFVFNLPYIFIKKKIIKNENHNKKQIAKFNNIRNEVFLEYFNQTYNDLKITRKFIESEIWSFFVPRLASISSNTWMNGLTKDRKVVNVYPGYAFETTNKVILNTFTLRVQELVRKRKGKNEYRYFNYLCAVIDNIPAVWNDVSFKIAPGQNNGNELENQLFNQSWSYFCQDPVKLRRLLTPWTQEKSLKVKYKHHFHQINNTCFWFGKNDEGIFMFNPKIKKTLEGTIEELSKDIVNDLGNLEKMIQDLSVYKAIIK